MKQNTNKYGLKSLKRDFPTDEACLEFIFDALHTRECSCGGRYSPVKGRRKFQCSKCRNQIAPTAGTIFHKSDTPLTLWFSAVLIFSNAKSGISAKELQRQLEVTYKCAYRILTLIRKAVKQDDQKLRGDVEIDTAFFGGKGNGGENNRRLGEVMEKKGVVIIAAERGGRIKAEVVKSSGTSEMQGFIARNIEPTATSLLTDSSAVYYRTAKTHNVRSVNHRKGEYVRGDIHINTIETFVAHLKRSIRGTFKGVSRPYLQSYLDAFVFHYNNRHSDKERFGALLGKLLPA